jgi:predicted tellurium resistance membrane protein TerC
LADESGLFLLGKATYEIHEQLEGAEHAGERKAVSFAGVIAQILVFDVVSPWSSCWCPQGRSASS